MAGDVRTCTMQKPKAPARQIQLTLQFECPLMTLVLPIEGAETSVRRRFVGSFWDALNRPSFNWALYLAKELRCVTGVDFRSWDIAMVHKIS